MMMHTSLSAKVLLLFLVVVFQQQTAAAQTEFTISYPAIFKVVGRPSELNSSQTLLLGQTFSDTYNGLEDRAATYATPPFMRSMTNVDIEQIGGLVQDPTVTQTFSIKFTATFTCLDEPCDPSLSLFYTDRPDGPWWVFATFPVWDGPAPRFFVVFYNLNLPDGLTAIDSIESNEQVKTIDCSDEISTGTTDIIIDFVGDVSKASEAELLLLASTFQETFNSLNGNLNPQTCDPFFREIVSVTIDQEASRTRRRLQGSTNIYANRPGYPAFSKSPFFTLFVRVDFNCRNCPEDSDLLDNEAGRFLRAMESDGLYLMPSNFRGLARKLQDNEEACTCADSANEFRSPSRAELSIGFNNAVQILSAQGQLDFIAEVEEVIEVDPVGCSSEVLTQTNDVAINVTGAIANVTDDDNRALEEAFVRAYNEAAEDTCDRFFRTVENVTVIELIDTSEGTGRRLMAPRPPGAVRPFTVIMKVRFRCRKCPAGSQIFAQDGGRFLDDVVRTSRSLQQNDTCYCSTDFATTDAPSASDFAVVYDRVLREDFNVPTIDSVEGAVDTSAPLAERFVDLSRWVDESLWSCASNYVTSPADWQVASDGLSVFQSVNSDATVFCSELPIVDETNLQGRIVVEGSSTDDDFIGFVFGFNPGDSSNPDANYLLVDWKRITQDFGPRGLAASRVTGVPCCRELWRHTNDNCTPDSAGVQELQRATTLGSTGWVRDQEYDFSFVFDATTLQVFVDGNLEISITGLFSTDGSLCFYNLSQDRVRYSGLSLEEGSPSPTFALSSLPSMAPSVVPECFQDSDCTSTNAICDANVCLLKGNPRFTLSWVGDDDLDLYVITPGQVTIYFSSKVDVVSGGFLDFDIIPQSFGNWRENTVFPLDGSAPIGTYLFTVNNFRQVGGADAWTLSVYVGDDLIEAYSGTTVGSEFAPLFNYTVVE